MIIMGFTLDYNNDMSSNFGKNLHLLRCFNLEVYFLSTSTPSPLHHRHYRLSPPWTTPLLAQLKKLSSLHH